jgi:hypothetical protein
VTGTTAHNSTRFGYLNVPTDLFLSDNTFDTLTSSPISVVGSGSTTYIRGHGNRYLSSGSPLIGSSCPALTNSSSAVVHVSNKSFCADIAGLAASTSDTAYNTVGASGSIGTNTYNGSAWALDGAGAPPTLLYYNSTQTGYTGSGSAQTIYTSSSIGPLSAGQGLEIFVQGIRTAGTGAQTWKVLLGSTGIYTCTFTNSSTSAGLPYLFHVRVKNTSGSVSTQIVDTDPAYVGTTMLCGPIGIGNNAYVNWSSAQTVSVQWTGATSGDTINAYQMAVYSKQ